MNLTQLCLGSGLEGVHPAVSLRSGTACSVGASLLTRAQSLVWEVPVFFFSSMVT